MSNSKMEVFVPVLNDTIPLKFSFELNRLDLILIMDAIGLPLDIYYDADPAMIKRSLQQILHKGQCVEEHAPVGAFLDIMGLPLWPKEQPVCEPKEGEDETDELAVQLHKSLQVDDTEPRKGTTERRDKEMFNDLGELFNRIGRLWDKGIRHVVVQNSAHVKSAINIRVLNVYRLTKQTPLMLVLFLPETSTNFHAGLRWVSSLPRQASGDIEFAEIHATDVVQKLLYQLLTQNINELDEEFDDKVERRVSEKDFMLSYIIPATPLSPNAEDDLANAPPRCMVCREDAPHRCSKCRVAWYCSPECQKSDWASHKSTCRPLNTGTWVTISFRLHMPGMEHLINTIVTHTGGLRQIFPEDVDPPEDIHGAEPFLVKVQLGLSQIGKPVPGAEMTVYDKGKSIYGYVVKRDCPDAYERTMRECLRTGVCGGVKMHRWAKRVGPWKIKICLDRPPYEQLVRW